MDRGDLATVLETRDSIRQDLLDSPAMRRCEVQWDSLILLDVCLEAIEEVAASAASANKTIPAEVLSAVDSLIWGLGLSISMPNHVRSEAEVTELLATPEVRSQLAAAYEAEPEIRHILEDETKLAEWMRGDPGMVELLERHARLADWLGWEPWERHKTAQAERLKLVLESYPERLRTSEHYLKHADAALTWRERIESLESALEMDADNVSARCELAGAFAMVGDLAGARREYREMLAGTDRPCHHRDRWEALEKQPLVLAAELDEPQEFLFYLW